MPLYLWDDEPWLFYRELWQKELIGFSYQFPQLEEVRFGLASFIGHAMANSFLEEWTGRVVIVIAMVIFATALWDNRRCRQNKLASTAVDYAL